MILSIILYVCAVIINEKQTMTLKKGLEGFMWGFVGKKVSEKCCKYGNVVWSQK